MSPDILNRIRIRHYEKAVNKIDDYYEYAYQFSDQKTNKDFVMNVLDTMAVNLEKEIKRKS